MHFYLHKIYSKKKNDTGHQDTSYGTIVEHYCCAEWMIKGFSLTSNQLVTFLEKLLLKGIHSSNIN